jgi:hypothetical protein
VKNEDPCVVDHRVDPAETSHGSIDDAPTDARLRDIASHRHRHRVVALVDRARIGHHCIAELAVGRHQALADPL